MSQATCRRQECGRWLTRLERTSLLVGRGGVSFHPCGAAFVFQCAEEESFAIIAAGTSQGHKLLVDEVNSDYFIKVILGRAQGCGASTVVEADHTRRLRAYSDV